MTGVDLVPRNLKIYKKKRKKERPYLPYAKSSFRSLRQTFEMREILQREREREDEGCKKKTTTTTTTEDGNLPFQSIEIIRTSS